MFDSGVDVVVESTGGRHVAICFLSARDADSRSSDTVSAFDDSEDAALPDEELDRCVS